MEAKDFDGATLRTKEKPMTLGFSFVLYTFIPAFLYSEYISWTLYGCLFLDADTLGMLWSIISVYNDEYIPFYGPYALG
ncbi:hypothetical protein JOD43_002421 [Pullulanibacillus pueri]|uniref:hypothetical protein n=1 Tax=Pullulanibacillus pueri TaxID=1437324 RepID=UPI00166A9B62|nr:hypothetical protein [Pullulanibacillus pueri]MBM7682248.1 hypothetical protein [Pullulanibacillus pueri]